MTLRIPTAAIIIPLLVASPMVGIGVYELTLGEMLVVAAGALYLAKTGFNTRLPLFLMAYLVLLTIGRITSLYNAPKFGIPVGLERISFLYMLALIVLGYQIGRRSDRDVETIMTGRAMTIVVLGVGMVAAVYPFIDVDVRESLLGWFVPDVFLSGRRLTRDRFPGLGVNANLYSFILCVVVLFAFSAYLKARASPLVPIAGIVAIVTMAGRLTIGLTLLGCWLLWRRQWRKETRARRMGGPRPRRRSRRVLVYATLIAAIGGAGWWYFGDRLSGVTERLVAIDRFLAVIAPNESPVGSEELSALGVRRYLWEIGMRRVWLAPIMGIAPNIWENSEVDPVLFQSPHNEFIFFWMAYGLAGLLAIVFLCLALLIKNLRREDSHVWVIVYSALMLQMTFDSAIQTVRFSALFFILVGLNVRGWARVARPSSPAGVTSAAAVFPTSPPITGVHAPASL